MSEANSIINQPQQSFLMKLQIARMSSGLRANNRRFRRSLVELREGEGVDLGLGNLFMIALLLVTVL